MHKYRDLFADKILRRFRFSILILCFVCVSFVTSAFAQSSDIEPEDELEILIRNLISVRYPLLVKENLVDKVIANARQYLGRPYKFRNPRGEIMDCSGFVGYIFSLEGIKLPRTATQQFNVSHQISISDVQKGDLLFFTGSNSSRRKIGHVSMVIDTSGGQVRMIHSSNRGVVIDNYPTAYYGKRFLYAARPRQLEEMISVNTSVH